MRRLALLIHHAGAAPDLIYPSLKMLKDTEIVTFFIKSPTNISLNNLYDKVIGTIGPAIECFDEIDLIKQVIKYNNQNEINGVFTLSEMLLLAASRISNEIGINFMSEDTINSTQNKVIQRKILKKAGVPIPKFYEIKEKKDIGIATNRVGFPSVLKPNYGGGGYGIFKVKSIEKLKKKYNIERLKYENIIQEDKNSTFNLEEDMKGEQWNLDDRIADYGSVESIVQNGKIIHLVISDRTHLLPPYRESGYISPSNLSNHYKSLLKQITTDALKALSIDNIMTHTEVKFTESGPKIIEVNVRPGGTVPFRILKATNGKFDLFLELAKMTLGERIKTKIKFEKYAASKISLCPEGTWKISNIEFSNIKNISSLDLMIPIADVGQKVSSYRGIEDLIGLYYLSNKNYENLITDMYEIDEKLMVEYEKSG
ncbi:MAG: ATP-grasp domain-containing protein [Methanobrevibacter sp.]|jgi:biotin carboxylase|nr:ATP-grasp domain-containing protein [Candidatus Methanovirga procula]